MNNQPQTAPSLAVTIGSSSTSETPKSDEYVVLAGKYQVLKSFYDWIMYQVLERLPSLMPNVDYTAKMICGNEFWLLLTEGECRLAGTCIAHMVKQGDFPLTPVKHKHEYPKKYQLK